MVRIEAIIRPSRLDEVKSALDDLGVHGISVTEIKGAGKQKGYTQHYRGSEYQVNLLPKVQVIVVVRDDQHTALSNAAFDQDLRSRNPEWGVRDLETVSELANDYGFARLIIEDMPANNLSLVFRRMAT